MSPSLLTAFALVSLNDLHLLALCLLESGHFVFSWAEDVYFLSFILISYNHMPDRSNLRKEGFILAHESQGRRSGSQMIIFHL